MSGEVIVIEHWRKARPDPQPWEGNYRAALTVQDLMDRLAFCDRKARIYVRNGWIAGAVTTREYVVGVYGQPSVLLYLNEAEVPR